MALEKKINQDLSVGTLDTLAYAKAVQGNHNYLKKKARFDVYVYLNKAARDAQKQPIDSVFYDIQELEQPEEKDQKGNLIQERIPGYDEIFGVPVLDKTDMNAQKSFYNWIKTLSRWQGWADV